MDRIQMCELLANQTSDATSYVEHVGDTEPCLPSMDDILQHISTQPVSVGIQEVAEAIIPASQLAITDTNNITTVPNVNELGVKLSTADDNKEPEIHYSPISLYEENRLLKRLRSCKTNLSEEMRRLRRKLILRKEKRKFNQPIFSIDLNRTLSYTETKDADHCKQNSAKLEDSNQYNIPISHKRLCDHNVLDRFQLNKISNVDLTSSFRTRLTGPEDYELKAIRSPYTTRLLKPFIYRDSESRPLKLSLLQEIISYPHQHDPHYIAPMTSPIDYCYVRPNHIRAVNTLCRQFFWPGIDLSECLHYPDFSCVVLYRKLVIAFAFMVPDLAESRHNEVYISFIFTHPEWRRAGIGSFMVYHLIQTCMGKDLTLHVAVNNPAMLLYQKFGFKPEQYIRDFYDKYYAPDSNQCMDAFFLRLRR